LQLTCAVESQFVAVHDPDNIQLVALLAALAVVTVTLPQNHAVHISCLRHQSGDLG
jgi:hypothetical protein